MIKLVHLIPVSRLLARTVVAALLLSFLGLGVDAAFPSVAKATMCGNGAVLCEAEWAPDAICIRLPFFSWCTEFYTYIPEGTGE